MPAVDKQRRVAGMTPCIMVFERCAGVAAHHAALLGQVTRRPAAEYRPGGRAKAIRREPGRKKEHKVVFTGRGWTCTSCGKTFKDRRAATVGECAGMLPAALLAHPTHQVHFASFVDCNVELPLVGCTRCGAHGTSKVANLAAPCPAAAATEARSRNAPFRRQAAAVAKMVHPSRRGVQP